MMAEAGEAMERLVRSYQEAVRERDELLRLFGQGRALSRHQRRTERAKRA
jgi:hypothetical protein